MMPNTHPDFLDRLVEELEPVQPLSARRAMLGLAGLVLIGGIAVAGTLGVRPDILAGNPNPMLFLRSGLLLMLGGIAAASALAMARPLVGRADRAWVGAAAMAAVVPGAALAYAVLDPPAAARAVWWPSAINCMIVSLSCAVGFAAIIVAQLRRGAPVLPERAAWVTGLAAGSLGVLVYSIHCPANHIAYIGLWYSLAIVISAIASRLIVPRFIRW
jgi:hypothetical protein